jgi:hypothetical protein
MKTYNRAKQLMEYAGSGENRYRTGSHREGNELKKDECKHSWRTPAHEPLSPQTKHHDIPDYCCTPSAPSRLSCGSRFAVYNNC